MYEKCKTCNITGTIIATVGVRNGLRQLEAFGGEQVGRRRTQGRGAGLTAELAGSKIRITLQRCEFENGVCTVADLRATHSSVVRGVRTEPRYKRG